MLEYLHRAEEYRKEEVHLAAFKPQIKTFFDNCVEFIQEARKRGENTIIMLIPFLVKDEYFLKITLQKFR